MFIKTKRGRALGQGLLIAGLVAASAAFVSPVSAGECPANKVKADATKPVTTPASGVTDNVLATLDLANEAPKLKGSEMRVRKLVIQPGGVVPWHSHADRPALIYIVEGEILEYASNCVDPILHKAGEVSREHHGIAHWWKNVSNKPVTLLSFDIRRDPNDKHM